MAKSTIFAGCTFWTLDGNLHRDDDEPASYHTGHKRWYQHGKKHRDGDKPAVVYSSLISEWYQNDELHRDGDKPAVIFFEGEGTKEWYQHGKRHRNGGKPAVEYANGKVEYWVDGIFIRKDWGISVKTPEMIGLVCVITLEVIYNDTDTGMCLTCRKSMIYNALKEWLKDNDTCPHCRSEWVNFIVYK